MKTFDNGKDIRKTFQSMRSAPLTQTMEGFGDKDDASQKLPLIFALPENQSEIIYSDMLQRLMVMVHRIKEVNSLWREHLKLVQNLVEIIDLFYMPEVHIYIVPLLFDFVTQGNKVLKESSCECLAKIAKYQHHSPSRMQVISQFRELGKSKSWSKRKSFIIFCKYAAKYLPFDFFKKFLLADYIKFSQDKISQIRKEFAESLLDVKPYCDCDTNTGHELMEII